MEIVSPELALIDPELARRARALPAPVVPRRLARPAQQSRRRGVVPRLVMVVLFASLAGNGMLAARLIAGTEPAPAVTETVTSAAAPPAAPSRSRVEQQLLAALLVHPQGRLPRRWIDRATGLPRGSLQARCGPASALVSCVVRPAGAPAREALRVRYAARPSFIRATSAEAAPARRPRSRPARRRG